MILPYARHLLLALGVAIISFGAIFVRLSSASPVTVTFFRAAYAVPVLVALRGVTGQGLARTRRQRLFAFVAGLVLAADHSAWHFAIELMGAGLATVVGSTHVVIMMIVGWLILGQRPTPLGLGAAPCVLVGVVLISGVVGRNARGEDPVLGVIVGLAMAFLYVIFLVLLRQSGIGGASPVGILLDATIGAAVGGLLLAPLDPMFSLVISWPAHGWLMALALGVQVVGWLLITYVLPRVEAWESSMVLVLEPAATVLWAYLILHEAFSASQWAGLLLVVAGVTAVGISRRSSVAGSRASIVP